MEFKKELINHRWNSDKFRGILICEENKELLIKLGADVFEKPKAKKFKAIIEDDNSNTEESI